MQVRIHAETGLQNPKTATDCADFTDAIMQISVESVKSVAMFACHFSF
jgi:hypothetical protein